MGQLDSPLQEAPCQEGPTIQTEADALVKLNTLDVSALKLGLERIQALMATLNNPQDALPTLHIAGTNGKGSTAAMLTAILSAQGLRVGTFTSPHLIHVRERIALNSQPIPSADFTQEVQALWSHLETLNLPKADWPTYFEFLNALAYCYFHRQQVDMAVMEVGLGGRMDSTNVVQRPAVCVITSIGMDHMERLGHTLEAIAAEKAGILKPGVPCVLGSGIPEAARRVILETAQRVGSGPVVEASTERVRLIPRQSDRLSPVQCVEDTRTGQQFLLSLLGTYQCANLATVLTVLDVLQEHTGRRISPLALSTGLKTCRWPARMQYFPEKRLVVDGSHNPDGFESLRQSLPPLAGEAPLYWLLSLRNNRSPEALLSLLKAFPQTRGVVWCEGPPGMKNPNLYHPAASLLAPTQTACPGVLAWGASTLEQGVLRLQEQLRQTPEALGVVTGSLYTAGSVLSALSPQGDAHA